MSDITGARERREQDAEDALKHLHESEYASEHCSLSSVAGALAVDQERATALAERLVAAGFARLLGDSRVALTDRGREEARRIIRAHRVYETYLARETGVSPEDWHRQADAAEHTLSAAEIDALADRLGRPRYDPHGDPIPTRDGALPPRRGKSLLDAPPGTGCLVVHIEDEPPGIYRRATSSGIFAGSVLNVLRRQQDSVVVGLEDRTCSLPLAVAAATHVEPYPIPSPVRALASLRPGESGELAYISRSVVGGERRRLLDLGLVPGTSIAREFDSMLGSPTAYRVRGAVIALRREQAARIFIGR